MIHDDNLAVDLSLDIRCLRKGYAWIEYDLHVFSIAERLH